MAKEKAAQTCQRGFQHFPSGGLQAPFFVSGLSSV